MLSIFCAYSAYILSICRTRPWNMELSLALMETRALWLTRYLIITMFLTTQQLQKVVLHILSIFKNLYYRKEGLKQNITQSLPGLCRGYVPHILATCWAYADIRRFNSELRHLAVYSRQKWPSLAILKEWRKLYIVNISAQEYAIVNIYIRICYAHAENMIGLHLAQSTAYARKLAVLHSQLILVKSFDKKQRTFTMGSTEHGGRHPVFIQPQTLGLVWITHCALLKKKEYA